MEPDSAAPGFADKESRPPAWARRVFKIGLWLLVPLAAYYAVELFNLFKSFGGSLVNAGDHRPLGRDFATWWTASRLVLDGHVLSLFDFEGFHQLQEIIFGQPLEDKPWGYPPHFILLILWLGSIPYRAALALWVGLTFALYAFAAAYKRPHSRRLVLLLALAPASFINGMEGQTGFLAAAFLIGGLRLIPARPILAGVLFGFLTFKPHMGMLLLVALAAGKHWRVFATAAVTALALVSLSVLCFGPEVWRLYADVTVPFQRNILEAEPQQIYQTMMISPFMAARWLGFGLEAAYAIAVMTAGATIAAVASVFRRRLPGDLRLAVLVTATFLASPYMFVYDMPALSAAIIAMLAMAGKKLRPVDVALCAFLWVAPLCVMPLNHAHLPLVPFAVAALLFRQMLWAVAARYPVAAPNTNV